MDPAYDYPTLIQRLHSRLQYDILPSGRSSMLIGLCFARPTSPLAKNEILPQIPDWHLRSGNSTDFYFAGFGDHEWDEGFQKVDLPGRGTWYYSPKAFQAFRTDVESRTKWRYSGGSDLILCAARWSERQSAPVIDFSCAIVCQLDAMKDAKAIVSVEQYFESVFRYAESAEFEPSILALSDEHGGRQVRSELKRLALSVLPGQLGSAWDKIASHAVMDIAR
jgi:hypothetical protein